MRVREHELDDADGQRGNQGLVVAVTNNTEVPGGQQPQELPEPELSRTFLRPSRASCSDRCLWENCDERSARQADNHI